MTITRQALISVSDKTGVVDLAQRLVRFGIGPHRAPPPLQDAGVKVTEIGANTGFPGCSTAASRAPSQSPCGHPGAA
jgi:phosphoribosylaminoimidazolecarboxamide formyltransferase/IMP cyclohydrolase